MRIKTIIQSLLVIPLIMLPVAIATGNTPPADSPLVLSLEKAREMALQHNTMMQSSRIDARIAGERIRETTAIGLPQINASVGYQYYLDVPTSLVPAEFFGGQAGEFAEIRFGTEHNVSATASVNQLVFSGEYIVGLRAARIYRDLAQKQTDRTALQVSELVTETYLQALSVSENLKIMEQNLENMLQIQNETEKLVKEGFSDMVNLDQLRLSVSNIRYAMASLERRQKLLNALLLFQMGLEANTPVSLSGELDEMLKGFDLQWILDSPFDPSRHVDFLFMETQEAFSSMVLKREQSQFLPSISASFIRQEMAMRTSFNFFDADQSWFPNTYLGIQIQVPLFSSGMRSSRVQQARLEMEKAGLGKYQTAQSLLLEMEQSRAALTTAIEQFTLQTVSMELAERILSRTRIRFNEGLAGSMELTQANEQYLNTQAAFIQAKAEVLMAGSKLLRARGMNQLPVSWQ